MNGIKIKKGYSWRKKDKCHDVYKGDGYQSGHFLLFNTKQRKIYVAQSNCNKLFDSKKCPHPSKELLVLRTLMGILFTILITRFTHIHFSYVAPNLKQVTFELLLDLYVRPVQIGQTISNRIPSISLTNTSSL